MDFAPRRPARQPRENIVPMINVVFLLLVFFVMTTQIAPPDPFDIAPPEAGDAPPPDAPDILFVAADGQLARAGLTGDAALGGIVAGQALTLRADRALPAPDLARLLARLAALGVTDVALVTQVRP
jgi:biopolymer transport protein ExbD